MIALDLPGHGESPAISSYGADAVAAAIHDAIHDAGLVAPVMVGHSLGGALATTYAGSYAVRGVVNLDQPVLVGGFRDLLLSVEAKLRGPDYLDVWNLMLSRMGIDGLPPTAQELLRTATTPRQDLLLGYWGEVLELSPEELLARRTHDMDTIRANGTPYHHISGDALPPQYATWLQTAVPQSTTTVLPGSGHFPHLSHPADIAKLLTA